LQQGRAGRVVVRAAAAAPAKAPATDLANLQFINPMWSQPKTEAVSSAAAAAADATPADMTELLT
jgi:hypothetical protein